ncbi:hypothetical protein [Streptomyces sp. NBC_00151]|uniref:hypothetical protein n=1 Tax=Streptomyces sp. NBC_00151 TaxID=2975669 RepID=UPI002DDC0298|nr:hypothetical protein [Streptomyces sp. NBC_00151]WRZ40403.1 hypothetical protein OG915_21540 [Streptomyces sp. NBC_00151]
MSNHKQQLDAAIQAFNQAERTEFMLTTATRWLGTDGPAYILGDIRVRALFEDIHGRHWADAYLAVESLSDAGRADPDHMEMYRQLAVDMDEARDLWVFTDTRGRWNAMMTPVEQLARRWEFPPPALLPGPNWARGWLDLPERTDGQELAWIAHGGIPVQTYRAGGLL